MKLQAVLFGIFASLVMHQSHTMERLKSLSKTARNSKRQLKTNDSENIHIETREKARAYIYSLIKNNQQCNDMTSLANLFFFSDESKLKNINHEIQRESVNIGIAFINQLLSKKLLSLEQVNKLIDQHIKVRRDKALTDIQYELLDNAIIKIEQLIEKHTSVQEALTLIREIHRLEPCTIGRSVPLFMSCDSAQYLDLFRKLQERNDWKEIDAIKSLNEYFLNQLKQIEVTDPSREIFLLRYAYFRNCLPSEILKQLPPLDKQSKIEAYQNICSFIGFDQAIGERNTQEDRFEFILDLENPEKRFLWLSVYDGHGGSQVAELARKTVGHALYEAIVNRSATNIDQAICEVFTKINTDIQKKAELDNIGSTVAGAIIYNDDLFTINCGDSRVVLASKEDELLLAHDLTTDHNPANKKELDRIMNCFHPGNLDALRRARLSKKQADIQSPQMRRSKEKGGIPSDHLVEFDIDEHLPLVKHNRAIAITRALGDKFFAPYLVGAPEIKSHKLSAKDQFLLLMTDGVYNSMKKTLSAACYQSYSAKSKNYALAKHCAHLREQGKSPTRIAQECVIERLSDDNKTIIYLDLERWLKNGNMPTEDKNSECI